MIWLIVLAVLVLLIVLTGLISWSIFYIQFSNSFVKRWHDQVVGLNAAARKFTEVQNQELHRIAASHDAESSSAREAAFRSYLAEVPVTELEAYPGIGPATVGKLAGEGYRNLASLTNANIHIFGLGQKRLADIGHAVRILLRNASSAFDSGACRQAKALAEKLNQLSGKYDSLKVGARARLQAAQGVIDQLRHPAAVARQVAFWRWLRLTPDQSLVPPTMLAAALPDLDSALRAADKAAADSLTVKRSSPAVAELQVPKNLRTDSTGSPSIATNANGTPHKPAREKSASAGNYRESPMPDETHLLLMELTVQFALAVARADGPVTPGEQGLIRTHIRSRFSYNRALLNRAEAFCAHYESAAIDFERCVREINLRFTADHRIALLDFASQIFAASGKQGSPAAHFLGALAKRFGVQPVARPAQDAPASPKAPTVMPISPPRRAAPAAQASATPSAPSTTPQVSTPSRARPPAPTTPPPIQPDGSAQRRERDPTRNEYLALIKISPSMPLSADLVRRQFNLLSEQLSPARVATMGQKFVDLAKIELASVRRAVEVLLEELGERLESKPVLVVTRDLRHNPDLDDVFGGG